MDIKLLVWFSNILSHSVDSVNCCLCWAKLFSFVCIYLHHWYLEVILKNHFWTNVMEASRLLPWSESLWFYLTFLILYSDFFLWSMRHNTFFLTILYCHFERLKLIVIKTAERNSGTGTRQGVVRLDFKSTINKKKNKKNWISSELKLFWCCRRNWGLAEINLWFFSGELVPTDRGKLHQDVLVTIHVVL